MGPPCFGKVASSAFRIRAPSAANTMAGMMRMTFTGSLSATLSPMITAGMFTRFLPRSCRGHDRIELLETGLFRPERDRGVESALLQERRQWSPEQNTASCGEGRRHDQL